MRASALDRSRGAEKRTFKPLEAGAPKTPFLRFGDRVRIEILARDGHSLFGAIGHKVVPFSPSA